jgi:hypothetical protein
LWISYKWFSTSHGHDNTGPMAGVPYDGVQSENADLYHDITEVHTKLDWNETGITEAWKQMWFRRIRISSTSSIPTFHCDGPIPFGDLGLGMLAHLYNQRAAKRGGVTDAIYTSKRREDPSRAPASSTSSAASSMQSAASVADRHVHRRLALQTRHHLQVREDHRRSARRHRQPQRQPDAELPAAEQRHAGRRRAEGVVGDHRLDGRELGGNPRHAAMEDFRRRARREGPESAGELVVQREGPQGPRPRRCPVHDEGRCYAIVMGLPGREAVIPALAMGGPNRVGTIRNMELLGAPES